MPGKCLKLEINDPKTFIYQGTNKKMTKYYLTANLFYSQKHWRIVDEIVDWAKEYLLQQGLLDHRHHVGSPNSLLKVTIQTNKKINTNTSCDLDGRGFFWSKIFMDLIQEPKEKKKGKYTLGLSIIKNDNMYWISKIEYEYKKGPEKLTFELIPREDNKEIRVEQAVAISRS